MIQGNITESKPGTKASYGSQYVPLSNAKSESANIGKPKLYFKELLLRNWRQYANDLELYLQPVLLQHIGYENLKFKFDVLGTSQEVVEENKTKELFQ